MTLGLICKKVGMSSVINDDGTITPVTVLEASDNRVVQIKQDTTDGYSAIQCAAGEQVIARVNNCIAGHYAKAKSPAGRVLREFRVAKSAVQDYELGQSITVDLFAEGQIVDVRGQTKGRGFAGVIKRHNFSMQDATHGNSLSHRAPGSIGQCQSPGRVFKGKKMAGHMGSVNRTTQNQKIIKIDQQKGLLLVGGAVPGAKNSFVTVSASVKNKSNPGAPDAS